MISTLARVDETLGIEVQPSGAAIVKEWIDRRRRHVPGEPLALATADQLIWHITRFGDPLHVPVGIAGVRPEAARSIAAQYMTDAVHCALAWQVLERVRQNVLLTHQQTALRGLVQAVEDRVVEVFRTIGRIHRPAGGFSAPSVTSGSPSPTPAAGPRYLLAPDVLAYIRDHGGFAPRGPVPAPAINLHDPERRVLEAILMELETCIVPIVEGLIESAGIAAGDDGM